VCDDARAVGQAILELSDVQPQVMADLSAPTVLQIIAPFASVIRNIALLGLRAAAISTRADSFSRHKSAYMHGACRVPVPSISAQLTMSKLSFLHFTVGERLAACAMFLGINVTPPLPLPVTPSDCPVSS
jgi:hypothetical protein